MAAEFKFGLSSFRLSFLWYARQRSQAYWLLLLPYSLSDITLGLEQKFSFRIFGENVFAYRIKAYSKLRKFAGKVVCSQKFREKVRFWRNLDNASIFVNIYVRKANLGDFSQ
jgi:hypothetical protein